MLHIFTKKHFYVGCFNIFHICILITVVILVYFTDFAFSFFRYYCLLLLLLLCNIFLLCWSNRINSFNSFDALINFICNCVFGLLSFIFFCLLFGSYVFSSSFLFLLLFFHHRINVQSIGFIYFFFISVCSCIFVHFILMIVAVSHSTKIKWVKWNTNMLTRMSCTCQKLVSKTRFKCTFHL